MLRNRLDIQLRNVCLIFRVYGWLQSLWTPYTPFAPSLEPLEYTAESRDRTGSQHDIQCSEPAAGSTTEVRRWGHVAANCRVCIVSRNLQSCHTLLPPVTALALLWGKRPCRRPRFIGPPFLPGRSRGRSASGDAFSHEAGIRARIMSISKALGAEKPAAKRPRSYMEGPFGRKLSIMSTGLPNTPSQKSKDQMLSFLRGYVRQNKGAHHEHQQRALGAEKPATKRPRSYMEGPRGGKTTCKKSKKTYMEGCFP